MIMMMMMTDDNDDDHDNDVDSRGEHRGQRGPEGRLPRLHQPRAGGANLGPGRAARPHQPHPQPALLPLVRPGEAEHRSHFE